VSVWDHPATPDELGSAAVLSPDDLRSYLATSGWDAVAQLARATVWRFVNERGEFQVLLPEDRQLRDYPSRVLDLIKTLAIVESRTAPSVLDDIRNTSVDTVTFRLLPHGPQGTAPLFSAIEAVSGIGEIFLASSYTPILGKSLLNQGRRPPEVRRFARRVRLGTPTAGSWMVSAQMDLSESDTGSTGDPLARQVTVQMYRAAGACLAAAGEALEDFHLEPFVRRRDEGVSANFCDALGKLGRDGTPFEMRFGWGRRFPSTLDARTHRFEPEAVEIIRRAGDALSSALPDGPVTVEGEVLRLSRGTGAEGQATVTGVAQSAYGESRLTVRTRLPESLYELAVEAHRLRQPVRLAGVANGNRIENVHLLEAMSPGDEVEAAADEG
jgi:hypothetical protein